MNGRNLTPEEREEWLSGLGGIGAAIDVNEEGILIKKVMADTPAAAAGLRPGDMILEIGGSLPPASWSAWAR
ncbi:MAG: PDZ domain-containing protein [Verrucomicrobiae bacterium]|nr:PDZ domain-containing protein [Verrucomicrobiae bacterium]